MSFARYALGMQSWARSLLSYKKGFDSAVHEEGKLEDAER